jgi:hypothetical protein
MVVLNNNSTQQTLNTRHFSEMLNNYKSGFDIISKSEIQNLNTLELPAKGAMIIELKQ